MTAPDVALVSGDLLFASRLRATLGADTVALVPGSVVPEVRTIFVDLNTDVERRLLLVAELRTRGQVRIIGFCQHDDREVRIRAMEHGADQVVTNGSLQQAAVRLAGREHV
ncbi:MAG: hypothetical protein M3R48_09210 [Candidatus Dormibacteraeota bacterium]|nr:hypothetical protein [Candidatus Dormibacteraeota bacterium]